VSGSFERIAAALTARAARLARAHVENRRAARREGTGWRSAARLWPRFANKD
jgi:hypothetical protein